MQVFEFLAMQEPRLTSRLVRSSRALPVVVILDLEDALWDVADPRRTSELKAQGRRDLVALADQDPDMFERQRIGVRVNRLSGPEAALDLAALEAAARSVTFDTIVLTKIEDGSEIAAWIEALGSRRIGYRRLVPIVETRRGVARLASIGSDARTAGVEWLVYGHYDFALDSGWWPVPDVGDRAFWAQAMPVIRQVERQGLGYVQAPFFQLDDLPRFDAILRRLTRSCRGEPGLITLGRAQTELASRSGASVPSGPGTRPARAGRRVRPEPDPRAHAERVVAAFLADRRVGVSFAVDRRRGEFISPHVYLAARAFLDGAADA